jgi:ATP-dependent DNA helicase RecG
MASLTSDLDKVQVARGGAVADELDVPLEALREIVSNALVHRSFAAGQVEATITVDVTDEMVTVTSPGGIHVTADPATLGLASIAGLRNLSLVRIGELLRTPKGSRIVEQQASGIAAANRACHQNGTMPPLFVDLPTLFQVILVRRALDTAPAMASLARVGLDPTPAAIRVLSVAHQLDLVRDESMGPGLAPIVLDARFVARTLAPCAVEDAAAVLLDLEAAGLLRRTGAHPRPGWALSASAPSAKQVAPSAKQAAPIEPPPVHTGRPRQDRLPELLAIIAASSDGNASAKTIGEGLGLTSPSSRNRWLRRAQENGLVEFTGNGPFDATGFYRLTPTGQARHEHTQASSPQ